MKLWQQSKRIKDVPQGPKPDRFGQGWPAGACRAAGHLQQPRFVNKSRSLQIEFSERKVHVCKVCHFSLRVQRPTHPPGNKDKRSTNSLLLA